MEQARSEQMKSMHEQAAERERVLNAKLDRADKFFKKLGYEVTYGKNL